MQTRKSVEISLGLHNFSDKWIAEAQLVLQKYLIKSLIVSAGISEYSLNIVTN